MKEEQKLTNAQFAKKDQQFRKACQLAGIEPSARQASKFRMKLGQAYNIINN